MRRHSLRLGTIGVSALLLVFVSSCGDSPSQPQSESPTGLRVQAPGQVATGVPFSVTVQAIGTGGTTLTSFGGTATLSSSAGNLTPTTVTLAQGQATLQVSITGASGTVTLRASAGDVEGSVDLAVVDTDRLLFGEPSAPANTAIPAISFVARADDYADGHPELSDLLLSFNTMQVVLEPETTVGEANDIFGDLDAELVGGIATEHDDVPGHAVLRIPSTTHAEMEAALSELRAHPRVRVAFQDLLMRMISALPANDASADDWVWEAQPTGGNYGMEMIRAPFMWNLNEKIQSRTPTGVLDGGFTSHQELVYHADLTPAGFPGTLDAATLEALDHGTHVAGTIAARHDDELGVEGVSPFADLVVRPVVPPTGASAIIARLRSAIALNDNFAELVRHGSAPRVVNISMGYEPGLSWTTSAWQSLLQNHGQAFSDLLTTLAAERPLPLIVSSAGNEGGVPAQWTSPRNYAGLVLNRREVIVVESVRPQGTDAVISSFSDFAGDISAPGGEDPTVGIPQVLSTGYSSLHLALQGTSMAAPHVTGVASFLLSADPSLTTAELRELLLAQSNTVAALGGASRRMDGYSALLDIDRVQNTDVVLRMLVDVDDGTEDGNWRADPDNNGADYTESDADGDGSIGDGVVDMSDFRRFRDAHLALAFLGLQNLVELDGTHAHPKKDLNGNGRTESQGDDETLYPRMDLNGDGNVVVLDSAVYVGGVFRRNVTDLDMIKELFDDPHYRRADLDTLHQSADIAIRPTELSVMENVVDIHSSVRLAEQEEAAEDSKFRRIHTGNGADGEGLWQVYTLKAVRSDLTELQYVAELVGIDAQGDTIASFERTFTTKLGGDYFWDPGCRMHAGDLTLRTQADVRAAAGICEILGGLTIIEDPIAGDPPVDLRPLASIERIENGIGIWATTQLSGLAGLEGVSIGGGGIGIVGNQRLATTGALGQTATDRSPGNTSIRISDNPILGDLTGIGQLLGNQGVVAATLAIENNPVLQSLMGLEGVVEAQEVRITGNPALSSLAGLAVMRLRGGVGTADPWGRMFVERNGITSFSIPSLTEVSGEITVSGNAGLATADLGLATIIIPVASGVGVTFSGNAALERVSIDITEGIPMLRLLDLPGLETLNLNITGGTASDLIISRTGLPSITTSTITRLDRGLMLYQNGNLASIEQLRRLTSVGAGLRINDNINLCIPDFVDDISVAGTRSIFGNKTEGCP